MSPARGQVRITKTVVDKAKEGHYSVSDRDLPGFSLRVQGKSKLFQIRYTGRSGRRHQVSIGAYPVWTAEQAREEAARLLLMVKKGQDPLELRKAEKAATVTMENLFQEYLQRYAAKKQTPGTRLNNERAWNKHLSHRVGNRLVAEITKQDVGRVLESIALDAPIQANRVRSLLSGVFRYAVNEGKRPDNPVRGTDKPTSEGKRKRDVFLTDQQWRDLFKAIKETSGIHSTSRDILILLIFTAARKREISTLTWQEVDLDHRVLRLRSSKTGRGRIFLGDTAAGILAAVNRATENPSPKESLFLGTIDASGDAFVDSRLDRDWRKIREAAGLHRDIVDGPDGMEPLVIHDLRHLAASKAAAIGLPMNDIKEALRHGVEKSVTASYVTPEEEGARAVVAGLDKILRAYMEPKEAAVVDLEKAGGEG